MRNILAACLFAAALLAGGAAGAVALPNDPPRAVLLPGGGRSCSPGARACPSSAPSPPDGMRRAAPCGRTRPLRLRCVPVVYSEEEMEWQPVKAGTLGERLFRIAEREAQRRIPAGSAAADPRGREERSKKDRMTGLFFMFPFPLPKGLPPTGSAALLPPVSPRRRSLQK